MSKSKDFSLNCPEEIINEDTIRHPLTQEDLEYLQSIPEEDMKVEEKLFIPLSDIAIRDAKFATFKRTITLKALVVNMRKYIEYYSSCLMNCFYTGFIGVVVCWDCSKVLDAFPCPQKRIYWMPSSNCGFCKGKIKMPGPLDLEYIKKLDYTKKDKIFHYDVIGV